MSSKPVHIAQISDLHIKPPGSLAYGRVDTARALERCVAALTQLDPAPDFVTPDLLGGAETTTIAKVVQERFLEARDWPYGAALGFVLMVITLGGTLIALRPLRSEVVGS